MLCMATTADANKTHDRCFKATESRRNDLLTEFMGRSSESCVVRKSYFQGFDESRAAVWSVACSNSKVLLDHAE